MARGITELDVFEAADALLARGERPTIDRVRQELGRGSPNTINPFLDAWWLALGKRVGGVQAAGLPPALVHACTKYYDELRTLALQEAQAAMAEQQRLALAARQTLEQAQAAMATEKAGLVSSIEALRGELGRVNDTNQALVRQLAQQQVDLDNAQAQATNATQQLKKAEENHQRAAAAARSELERVREQWQGNESRWLGEIDHLRDEAKRLRSEHERAQKTLLGRVQELDQQLSAGAKERAALRVAVESAQRDLAKEREKRSFAEGALAASRERSKPNAATAPRRRRVREVS